jgi:hypothetical protein
VHPSDPETLWIRRNGSPGTLWVTRNGGESFTMALSVNGPMKAVALSPDGERVLAGNLTDGLHRADTESLAVERVACDGVDQRLRGRLAQRADAAQHGGLRR